MSKKYLRALDSGLTSSNADSSLNDYQIIELINAGHNEQYELITRRYNQRLYRIARSILLDDQLAMDAVQNAHIKVFNNLSTYQGDSGFSTWISTIARNEALMMLRKIRSEKLVELDESNKATILPIHADSSIATLKNPEDELANSELRLLLNSHIDSLPERFREAFVMRCVEGFSVRETSEILDVNAVTIKTRVFRAKALLHQRIASKYGDRTYEIGGHHCDQIVSNVMQKVVPNT